jgi:phosphatidylserine/phosphatidylglycerophosphate/cardiolipin synthase-like enzyme
MRFRSQPTSGYVIHAVSGINTISFAIDSTDADTAGLLGFAVERLDLQANEQYFMYGFKVFKSVIPAPTKAMVVSTRDHPIQSFVWDDFTAKADHRYTYRFHPLKGVPKNIDRSAAPISIDVRTEPLYTNGPHDVFFNRGVASSQAYERRFGNKRPDALQPPSKRKEALDWLSRDLDNALLKFIANAKAGDTLRCCFYEFRYEPVATALKKAISDGVDVQLIIDAKVNEHTDSKGKFHESFPRVENRQTIKDAGIPAARVHLREAKRNDIQHNKFMVLLKGAVRTPAEVWTGSTNISMGGIHGQTNVGHWLRDRAVAERFAAYWALLEQDPGGKVGDSAAAVRKKNDEFKKAVEALRPVPEQLAEVAPGTTPIFSPRRGGSILALYFQLVDEADDLACITLAFGINKDFKARLTDNTADNAIAFFLLEKKDKPTKANENTFVFIGAKQNIYKAWGSFLREPLHQWAKETSAMGLGLNQHVSFIHSKFLLRDPLGADPIVITGSANFSDASTNDNDENMIAIRGDRRVADIYFTEFNRLFNHYYFRSVVESVKDRDANVNMDASLFLTEKDQWLEKYKPGSLRAKRVAVFKDMAVS